MQILPFDYESDQEILGQGLALVAAEAKRAADEVPNAIWFDVGDVFEGGPLDDELAAGEMPHPMPAALAAAGVAAGTLGNHDFDHGLAALERVIKATDLPLTLSNIVRHRGATPLEDAPFLPPFLLIPVDLACGDGATRRLTLGVIGAAPPQTLDWNAARLSAQLEARDIVEAVAAWVPEARKAGADLAIVLSHSGIGAAVPPSRAENASVPVAAIPGVDAVLTGHSHLHFPDRGFTPHPTAGDVLDRDLGLLHGKPAVMPGVWGQRLGQIDLVLELASGSGWRVTGAETKLRPVRGTIRDADAAVASAGAVYHAKARAAMDASIGQTVHPLSTHFALVQDCTAVRFVHAAQLAAGRALQACGPARDVPLISATAPLRAGGRQGPGHYTDIPAGIFRRRDLQALYGYANLLELVWISGTELRHWLERSASLFATVREGAHTAQLHNPDHPGYQFDMMSGATCRIDLTVDAAFDSAGARTASPGGRVQNLRVRGRPVQPSDRFALVTSSYRTGGGAGFPTFTPEDVIARNGEATRGALARFLREGGGERPLPAPAWSFRPLQGTRAVFQTAPVASERPLPSGGDGVLSRLGPGEGGFDLWSIDLGQSGRLAAS